MTFEERKQIASELLVAFLDEYVPPRGLDEGQLANRISNAADAFARRMPIGMDYAEKCQAVLTRIRDSHESNSWPPQAAFVNAMPAGEFRKSAPSSYKSDNPNRIPQLMSQGLSVPEREIWRDWHMDRDLLDRYRRASVDNWRDVYRNEAAPMMAEKYGPIVHRYFMQEAAE